MSAASSNAHPAETADRELVITRVFDAPRETVFKAWTDPDCLAKWWGPRGFVVLSCVLESRMGGKIAIRAQSDERIIHAEGVVREIVPPEKLAFTTAWIDQNGNAGHETLVTLMFEPIGAKTRLIFRQGLFESVNARDLHQGGWSSAFDCLAEYLATLA